jgi:predicted nuclease of predicted toxin-antitoxin system
LSQESVAAGLASGASESESQTSSNFSVPERRLMKSCGIMHFWSAMTFWQQLSTRPARPITWFCRPREVFGCNQLPVALAHFLTSQGHDAEHVLDLRMDEEDDLAIWNYALRETRILITKDQDFFHLATHGAGTGSIIWVRMGNCRNQMLIAAFERALAQIMAAVEQGNRIVELR